jgi:hypothetical protein
MSRLAPALACRIDRLARGAHAFHRFAHHPLCERYAGELIPLGRRARVCRGCMAALSGCVLGLSCGAAWVPNLSVVLVASLGAAALFLLSLAARLPKLITRLLPAFLGSTAWSAACVRAFTGDRIALLAGAGLTSLALFAIIVYRRRGPSRTPCRECPERSHRPCSGYAPIVRRERAFQRLAQRWIDAAQQYR